MSRAYLNSSRWEGATLKKSIFNNAEANDILLDGATLTQCTFLGTKMRRTVQNPGLRLGACLGTHFIDCDFRGADISGLRFANTTFERCKFHGLIGAPVLEGPVTIIDADFSANGDSSDMRSQADILAQWRTAGTP